MTDLLEISGLAKSFGGTPVLRDVSFSVAAGSLAAILGASGSGKTTLLRLIAGFEQPDAGEIRLGGKLIACAKTCQKPEQRGIGYVAQEGALFPHLSVADNITFGLPRAQRRARHRVAELLALTGLPEHYADRAPSSLSGGEQQRVALARALAPNPRLVLLDEPFSALDAGLRDETREAVAAALRGAGATAILVTHDQAEAMSMGARVGVLQDGTLKQIATPEALYRLPADAALANFVGDAVFAPGIAADGMVETALGRLHLAPHAPLGAPRGEVTVMIRPEQIKIFGNDSPGAAAATIERIMFHGHDASVRLALKNPGVTGLTARVFSHSLPDPGSDVWLRIEGDVVAYPASAKTQTLTVD